MPPKSKVGRPAKTKVGRPPKAKVEKPPKSKSGRPPKAKDEKPPKSNVEGPPKGNVRQPPKSKIAQSTKNARSVDHKEDPAIDFTNQAQALDEIDNRDVHTLPIDLQAFLEIEFPKFIHGEPTTIDANISRCFLFYGPPGTGKSRTCSILAREMRDIFTEALSSGELSEKLTADRPSTDFYFHHLSASTLVSAMAGRAEKNIEDILCIIPRKFPISVILLDEVDGLLGQVASHGEGATMERVTKMFQSIVQGGTGPSVMPDNTFLFATSNMVEKDLKKPWVQRFGHQTFLGPPSTTKELGEIIQRMWMAKLEPLRKRFCSPNDGITLLLVIDEAFLHTLLQRETSPRDIERVMAEMGKLNLSRDLLKKRYLDEHPDASSEEIRAATGELSELREPQAYFKAAARKILLKEDPTVDFSFERTKRSRKRPVPVEDTSNDQQQHSDHHSEAQSHKDSDDEHVNEEIVGQTSSRMLSFHYLYKGNPCCTIADIEKVHVLKKRRLATLLEKAQTQPDEAVMVHKRKVKHEPSKRVHIDEEDLQKGGKGGVYLYSRALVERMLSTDEGRNGAKKRKIALQQ